LIIAADKGGHPVHARQYDQSISEFRAVLELD
jgi:hypothetical protein